MPKSVKDIAEGPFVSRGFSDFESTMQKITADRKEITAALEAATKQAADNAAIMNANGIAVKELIQLATDEMSKWKTTAEEANKRETNIEEVLSKKTKLNELLDKTLPQLPDSTDLSQEEFFSESDFLKFSESKREIERKKDELSKLETALRDKLLPKESKGKGLTKKRKSTRRRRSRRHRKSTRRRRRKH